MNRLRRGAPVLSLLIAGGFVVGLLGGGSAKATAISRPPDVMATVTASIKPTRLPADGTAPITLEIDGNATRRPTCLGDCASLRTFAVRLDPQIAVDTEGLPTCRVSDVKGYDPRHVRRKCGRALIGSGKTTETIQFVEVPSFTVSSEQLFFNAGKGRVLMYSYAAQSQSSGAGLVGTIRNLTFRTGGSAAEVSFQLRFGKTWRLQREKHSYLNGQCRTGVLRQRVTLELSDGTSASEAPPERCTPQS